MKETLQMKQNAKKVVNQLNKPNSDFNNHLIVLLIGRSMTDLDLKRWMTFMLIYYQNKFNFRKFIKKINDFEH